MRGSVATYSCSALVIPVPPQPIATATGTAAETKIAVKILANYDYFASVRICSHLSPNKDKTTKLKYTNQ